MPIKFRCHHCRQFLGISRGMAEKVVDCPSCGRTIRVPDLDGRVAPLPQPKLDLADSSLLDALDRLASIGSVPGLVLADSESPSDESGDLSEDAFAPVALNAPQPVPVPAAATSSSPIAPEPVPPEGVSAPPPRVDYRPDDDALAPLTRSDPVAPVRTAAGISPTTMILVAAGIGLVGAVAGVAAGRLLFPASTDGTNVVDDDGEQPSDGNDGTNVVEDGAAIAGRITYRTEAGDKPDAGARILALPDERTGTAKIGIAGLRPGDTKADFRVAKAAINALGGDVAVVGADGTFTLELPLAGTYQVVVLSHYQAREEGEPLPPSVEQLLAKYLDRPSQLIGEGQIEFARVLWKGIGSDPVPWSHTFTSNDS